MRVDSASPPAFFSLRFSIAWPLFFLLSYTLKKNLLQFIWKLVETKRLDGVVRDAGELQRPPTSICRL